MIGQFELHIGFLQSDRHIARDVLATLQLAASDWHASRVDAVRDIRPGFDPHNVPGTLGMLVSRDLAADSFREVPGELLRVLDVVAQAGAPGARVELEYVLGRTVIADRSAAARYDPPRFNTAALSDIEHLKIKETPAYEIHFVARPTKSRTEVVSMDEIEHLLGSHGVTPSQTILYVPSGQDARPSAITTSYYDDHSSAAAEAARLAADKSLSRALTSGNLQLKLVVERIIACYQPGDPRGASNA